MIDTNETMPDVDPGHTTDLRASLQTLSRQSSMQLTITLDPQDWLVLGRVADKRGISLDELASEALEPGLETLQDELRGLSAS